MPNRRINVGVMRAAADIIGWVLAVFAVLVGLLILLGGPERWQAAAYKTAMELPGAPATWGWIILFAGVLLTFGNLVVSRQSIIVSCGVAALWCTFFAITFGAQLFRDPEGVGNLGPAVWGFIAIIYLLHAAAHSRRLR